MDWIQVIITMIGGIGFGTILSTILQNVLQNKRRDQERKYEEKRNAYIGFLQAMIESANNPSMGNLNEYELFQLKIELFGSKEVALLAKNGQLYRSRDDLFNELLRKMKNDLLK